MIVTKGTGINVYSIIRAQLNISFVLDGGSLSTFVYVYPYYNGGTTGCYNTLVYNTQLLTYGTHSLNVTMLTYTFTYTSPDSQQVYSDLFFDYAVISTSSSPTSSSVIPSSTGNFGPSSQPSQYVSLHPCRMSY